MKYLVPFLLVFTTSVKAQKIHFKSVLVDTHNDAVTACIEKKVSLDQNLKGINHSDLTRFKEGGLDYQLFSIWCDGEKVNPYAWAMREMDTIDAVAARNPDKMVVAKDWKTIKKTLKQGKIVAQYGVEGGHMIEDKIERLDTFYKRGVRYMTLTWNNSPSWASSHTFEKTPITGTQQKGLNAFGLQIIERMNQLGIIVDVSHVGEATFWDVINNSKKPIMASHSNAFSLCGVTRNLKDEQIKAIGKNGGVICLNFSSGFVDSNYAKKDMAFRKKHQAELDSLLATGIQREYAYSALTSKYFEESEAIKPTMAQLLDHLDYIVKLIGVNHVGIGSDFDGISSSPRELQTVADFPKMTQALIEKGYSNKDIKKILGGNFLRVYRINNPA